MEKTNGTLTLNVTRSNGRAMPLHSASGTTAHAKTSTGTSGQCAAKPTSSSPATSVNFVSGCRRCKPRPHRKAKLRSSPLAFEDVRRAREACDQARREAADDQPDDDERH